MGVKVYFVSLFLLTTFPQCRSYTMVIHDDIMVNLTCLLPPDRHANKLVVVKGNLKNNTFKAIIDIHDAGEDSICYCNDPVKEYNVELPKRSSRNDEGRYRCIFYYNGTESYRHGIELRVMPHVDVYAIDNIDKGLIDFIINRTRTMEDHEVKVDARAGGVKLSEDIQVFVEYKKDHECKKIVANTNYTDCTTTVIFTVSYLGLSRDYIASMNSYDEKSPYLSVVLISGSSLMEPGQKSRYKRWLV
ncbi:V-type Ig domain protein [Penguinpox virus]|uniref:V-type Ig domain protein n=1 Tax=Penguinpox virus TaxID=648998 RepID=A0A068EF11_9POXV|nr:V-type Ig domain protein [Penguinpox virus]AID46761.1 V-type Ig domain protein [Penguinpox virus]